MQPALKKFGIVRLTRKPAQASGVVVSSAHEYTTSPLL
jgi:hypothetical protein